VSEQGNGSKVQTNRHIRLRKCLFVFEALLGRSKTWNGENELVSLSGTLPERDARRT
jgi:hypothetical protein